MGRALFYSTIEEKKNLRERLDKALNNPSLSRSDKREILSAMDIVDDALLLHEFRLIVDKCSMSVSSSKDIDNFFETIKKRKRKRNHLA
jgi:hypothetical protein